MPENTPANKTYRRIRNAIGVMGIGLPIVLILLSFVPFFETKHQPSISHYYYTNFREIFTGVLCAVGLFLIRYDGHTNSNFFKNDSQLTNIAGWMAFGVALFPTNNCCDAKIYTLLPICHAAIGWLHYGFAAVFFITLAIISINVFTIGQNQDESIELSILNENNIYRTCGWLMLLFIILVPILGWLNINHYSTLILEALALFVFGFSWLIKGRGLGDSGKLGRVLYRE
ncbi:MAG: hypothetical protein ACLGGV_06720 [Bacteroidia bacterium]